MASQLESFDKSCDYSMVNAAVVVNCRFEGLHSWPECPFDAVSFLRSPHRHVFHVKVMKKVSHDDRAVEIIMLKRDIEKWGKEIYNFGRSSCEEIARVLIDKFDLLNCEVLEDGENGAYLWRSKT